MNEIISINLCRRVRPRKVQIWLPTYFGHGVIFEIKSSTANDMPRTNKQLPSPFHSVVTPCRWCKWMITGTSVNGIKWCLYELWCTWHCRRSTTNGWLNKFSVIKLTRPTLPPKYFFSDSSSSSNAPTPTATNTSATTPADAVPTWTSIRHDIRLRIFNFNSNIHWHGRLLYTFVLPQNRRLLGWNFLEKKSRNILNLLYTSAFANRTTFWGSSRT